MGRKRASECGERVGEKRGELGDRRVSARGVNEWEERGE